MREITLNLSYPVEVKLWGKHLLWASHVLGIRALISGDIIGFQFKVEESLTYFK